MTNTTPDPDAFDWDRFLEQLQNHTAHERIKAIAAEQAHVDQWDYGNHQS